jgi:hypothetical protein
MTDDELKRLLDANATENRRHFNETADRLSAENRQFFELATEGLRHEIQLVAEGVSDTREALFRDTANIRDEMRRGFADTQAMIKFSHAELDRRVRALEESQRTVDQTLADVQARLERLESSTH